MAKAAPWTRTDAQVRKRGEQTGLDTLVVHAVNDSTWRLCPLGVASGANALSNRLEYGRKVKTQMN